MPIVRTRGTARTLAVIGASAALLAGVVTPALAASTVTATGLTAAVSGTTVTVSTTISASPATVAAYAGICARTADGNHRDFPLSTGVTLSATGTKITKTATLPVGTYSYWSCAKVDGVWKDLDARKSVTVGAPAAGTGGAMPVGNLTNFKQVFTDDFTTDLALGSFPGAYASKWVSYDGFADSRGKGDYNQDIISVKNGVMDLYLHSVNGRPQVAAPSPIVTQPWEGQLYGKFSVRFKSDQLRGYGAAWLLWPDSNDWNQGEIDFPEGGLDGTFWGFNHCINNARSNCDYVDTKTTYANWHTASVEWTPKGVAFILDGVTLKTSTSAIPKNPLHWVLQTETNADTATAAGHLQIDWVSVYSYTG